MLLLRENIAVRIVLLTLQLAFIFASIPHLHALNSAGDHRVIAASSDATKSVHAFTGCTECLLSGTWVAETTSRLRLIDDLPCQGVAVLPGLCVITHHTLLSTRLRGPPIV
ncbi:MAG: hypothetical protein IPP94_07010 [Ignavibacteria bacterium]|nr:hypothetical protein [Ignavibacteria bacterium]